MSRPERRVLCSTSPACALAPSSGPQVCTQSGAAPTMIRQGSIACQASRARLVSLFPQPESACMGITHTLQRPHVLEL